MLFLEYSYWTPSRRALIYFSTSKSLKFHAAIHVLICELSRHRPEEARVRYFWDTWSAKLQVDSRDQTSFVSDPVSSSLKSLVICFLSNKSLTLGLFFSTSVKVFYFSLFFGFTGSWTGCFLMIEVSVVVILSYKSPVVFLSFIPLLSDLFVSKSLIFEAIISLIDILYPVNYIIKVRF